MTQLKINGVSLPEAVGKEGSYKVYPVQLRQQVEMISGRLVQETRGEVTLIEYSYLWFDDPLLRHCLQAYRSRSPLQVEYLDMETNTMKSSQFFITSFSSPSYLMEVNGVPYWTNISFSMREVRPND